MFVVFRLPRDQDCHELWSKMRKRKQREQQATGLKLEEQYPAPPPRSRTSQLQGTGNSAKSTPERNKLSKTGGDENTAPNKVNKKDGMGDATQSKGSLHRTVSDNSVMTKVNKFK